MMEESRAECDGNGITIEAARIARREGRTSSWVIQDSPRSLSLPQMCRASEWDGWNRGRRTSGEAGADPMHPITRGRVKHLCHP
jgi:hypothetical protein